MGELPIADVIGALRAVFSQRPDIVTAGAVDILTAGETVLVGIAPWVCRNFFDVGTLPAGFLASGCLCKRADPFLGTGVTPQVDLVCGKAQLHGLVHKDARYFRLLPAEDLADVANRKCGNHRDQRDHDEDFNQTETAVAGGATRRTEEQIMIHGKQVWSDTGILFQQRRGASGKSQAARKMLTGLLSWQTRILLSCSMQPNAQIFDALSRSTPNAAWGALAMEVLARLGVETVIISPGARSTPLVYAAVRNPKLEVIPVLDERAAAFFALGIAKRTGRPAVLICTSGSAVANYAPAVAEADHSGTPLLVLTADRAPEERHCGAGQTIDQIHYFGEQVRAFEELPLPEASPAALRHLRQALVHALDRALHGNPGPVHLNCPFREPLAPDPEAQPVLDAEALEHAATVLTRSTEAVPASGRPDAVALERLASHQHGCIVVGDLNPGGAERAAAFAHALTQLSKALGWPVLTDVLNPLRAHAPDAPALVTQYHAILRDPERAAQLAPTAVLQIGNLPTSKILRQWLAGLDAATFLLPGRPINIDPLHRVATLIQGDAIHLAETLSPQTADPDWQTRWETAQGEATAQVDAQMRACAPLFGGKVPWLLSQCLPAGRSVFFANSLSVRFAEWFWKAGKGRGALLGNRGVNGIDGNLATALGVAHKGAPTVLLCGDLAFLHDHASLLLARELQGSLTVLLLNNSGGGVFELLPIAQHEPPYERYFATPQTVEVATLCAAHGIEHTAVSDWPTLEDALLETPPGVRVLELHTDRVADRDCLHSIFN